MGWRTGRIIGMVAGSPCWRPDQHKTCPATSPDTRNLSPTSQVQGQCAAGPSGTTDDPGAYPCYRKPMEQGAGRDRGPGREAEARRRPLPGRLLDDRLLDALPARPSPSGGPDAPAPHRATVALSAAAASASPISRIGRAACAGCLTLAPDPRPCGAADGYLRLIVGNRRKEWWAHKDSNLGPAD